MDPNIAWGLRRLGYRGEGRRLAWIRISQPEHRLESINYPIHDDMPAVDAPSWGQALDFLEEKGFPWRRDPASELGPWYAGDGEHLIAGAQSAVELVTAILERMLGRKAQGGRQR